MKALTIWQPWASLIIAGAKPWEWRGGSYLDRRRYINGPKVGERIAIHAAARRVDQAEIAVIFETLDAGDSSLVNSLARSLLTRTPLVGWPRSSVLGTAIIGEPIGALAWARANCKNGFDSDRIDHHKFAWPLSEIIRFEPFIPARGSQGFWTFNDAPA